ncbi:MAG: LEA type 2 family protein, partial [Geminicoccaceae bacterium]
MSTNATRRLSLLGFLALAACASLTGREPLSVDVAGIEPLPSEGMEGRFLVKLRVQNPNETPVDFDGVSLRLDVRGQRLATGVSDARGTVPRFGETVLAVPVSVPGTALVRLALGLAGGCVRLVF